MTGAAATPPLSFSKGLLMRLVRRIVCVAALAAVLPLLGACQQHMVPTPYAMYGDAGRAVYAKTPPAMQTSDIPIVYVTDRVCDGQSDHGPKYGYGRSKSVAYGTVTVSLDPTPTWDQLVADSTTGKRSKDYVPRVSRIEEQGKFAPILERVEPRDGRLEPKPGALEAVREEQKEFYRVLNRWLEQSKEKEVVVFVHGFNNDFEGAAMRLAQAWHLSGRQGVPILYTWPAGYGSRIRGYNRDRESGEFTNIHLKQLLVTLAACPQIEKVHLVSHSRGTDVASTAIRELHAEIRGMTRTNPLMTALLPGASAGADATARKDAPLTWQILKLETLVLAAPDMDLEVFVQRFFSENAIRAANRVVIYFSAKDEALALSDFLFASERRLGAISLEDFKPENRAVLAALPNLEVINCPVTGYSSHSYLAEHPAALSDLILLIRDHAPAGSPARPLKRPSEGLWELDDDYLKPKAAGDAAAHQ